MLPLTDPEGERQGVAGDTLGSRASFGTWAWVLRGLFRASSDGAPTHFTDVRAGQVQPARSARVPWAWRGRRLWELLTGQPLGVRLSNALHTGDRLAFEHGLARACDAAIQQSLSPRRRIATQGWQRAPDSQQTLLHRAAGWGRTEAVLALLERGADPAARTHYGFTPIMTASLMGEPLTAALLAELAGQPLDNPHPILSNYIEDFLGPTSRETLTRALQRTTPYQAGEWLAAWRALTLEQQLPTTPQGARPRF